MDPSATRITVLTFVSLASLLCCGQISTGEELHGGDILVSSYPHFGCDPPVGEYGVFQVNPVTGAQTPISSGYADEIAVASDGDIFLLDWSDAPVTGSITRLDPVTGGETVVSTGGHFGVLMGMAVDAAGDILVSSYPHFGCDPPVGEYGIFQVNPVTGAQTRISSGYADEIAVAPDGDIFLLDWSDAPVTGSITRLDPVTGGEIAVSTGGHFGVLHGMAVDAAGDILVSSYPHFGCDPPVGEYGIFQVNPVTGAQTRISSGYADEIAVAPDGDIFLLDWSDAPVTGSITRLDPVTGAETVISTGGDFGVLHGIAIVPEPSTLALAASAVLCLVAYAWRKRRAA